MATYVLKVNAHPSSPAFPTSPSEWEGLQFFGPAPRTTIGSKERPPEPKSNDRVHIWINETGGGGGYTGYGKVLSDFAPFSGKKNPTFDFRLTKARLLPSPIAGEHFWKHSDSVEAISSLRRYTLRQLLWLNKLQAADFEAALRMIAIERFGDAVKGYI